jgi:hypothetical protein
VTTICEESSLVWKRERGEKEIANLQQQMRAQQQASRDPTQVPRPRIETLLAPAQPENPRETRAGNGPSRAHLAENAGDAKHEESGYGPGDGVHRAATSAEGGEDTECCAFGLKRDGKKRREGRRRKRKEERGRKVCERRVGVGGAEERRAGTKGERLESLRGWRKQGKRTW